MGPPYNHHCTEIFHLMNWIAINETIFECSISLDMLWSLQIKYNSVCIYREYGMKLCFWACVCVFVNSFIQFIIQSKTFSKFKPFFLCYYMRFIIFMCISISYIYVGSSSRSSNNIEIYHYEKDNVMCILHSNSFSNGDKDFV